MHLAVSPNKGVFLQGIDRLELPIAHAEGKFVARDPNVLGRLADDQRIVLAYRPADDGEAGAANGQEDPFGASVPFPDNPNGSQANVAGICDATGRVLGMMPHPERYIFAHQHPRWTRGEHQEARWGRRLFANAVAYCSG